MQSPNLVLLTLTLSHLLPSSSYFSPSQDTHPLFLSFSCTEHHTQKDQKPPIINHLHNLEPFPLTFATKSTTFNQIPHKTKTRKPKSNQRSCFVSPLFTSFLEYPFVFYPSKPHFLLMGCSASSHHRKPSIEDNPFSTSSSSGHRSPAPPSTAATAKSPLVAKTRSLSAPLVHHFPIRKGDSHHLVSLTSSTYGSLSLVDRLVDGRASSDSRDPSSPDSVINTWELMEGLEEEFRVEFSGSGQAKGIGFEGFGEDRKIPSWGNGVDSNGLVEKVSDSFSLIEKQKGEVEELGSNGVVSNPNSKPLWKYLSEEALLSKMDPNVASSYIRALSSRQLGYDRSRVAKSMGSSPCQLFNTKANSVGSSPLVSTMSTNKSQLAGCEDRIVLYFTSLRGIRRTYEDCCAVKMIFRGFRVQVDERDISMDSMYRKELLSVLGGKPMSLPQVFIRGKHIGGAEEIKQLHEVGELAKLLVGFPVRDYAFICDGCGNARFVPCTSCNGSRKVFVEDEDRLRRCQDCNENGLVRCPVCNS